MGGPGEDRPRSIELAVPKDMKPGAALFALSRAGGGALPVPLVVTTLPVVRDGRQSGGRRCRPGGDAAGRALRPVG